VGHQLDASGTHAIRSGDEGGRKAIGSLRSDIARIGCVAAGAVTLYHPEPRARPSAWLLPRCSRWRRRLRKRSVLESRPHQLEPVFDRAGPHGHRQPAERRRRPKRAGGFSIRQSRRHRRRRHGNGRILVFRRQNKPEGLQLRFLPRCQQLAADGTLYAAWTSFRRYRLGDLIRGQAGRTGNVGYFHGRNVIDCQRVYQSKSMRHHKGRSAVFFRSCAGAVFPAPAGPCSGRSDASPPHANSASGISRTNRARSGASRSAWCRHLPTDDE
jgi:hypothetical protein